VFSFKLPGFVLKELERLFSNFIWNNKMHGWNWKDIYRPKAEGVGIRRLIDINQASCIRLVWRLFTSNSIWSQWMCVHYLNGMHISRVSASITLELRNGYAA